MTMRARKTCFALLFTSIMMVSFCLAIGVSSAATGLVIKPQIQSAPTIDGSLTATPADTVWASANYTTVSNLIINGTNSNNLKILCLICGTNIYFGLLLETTTHSYNESFALALSNESVSQLIKTSHTSTPSLWNFNTTKCVRHGGASWDMTIDQTNKRFSNMTAGNGINFAQGITSENWTFYDLSLSLNSTHSGDINWQNGSQFAMKIFYGNTYGGKNVSYYPLIDKWASTGLITVDTSILVTSKNPITGTLTAGQFNEIVAETIFFVIAIIMIGGIGVYIMNSKKRMRRA